MLTEQNLEFFAKNISFVDSNNNIVSPELVNLELLPAQIFLKDESGLPMTEKDDITAIAVRRDMLLQFLL